MAASLIWGINTIFLLDAGLDELRGLRRQRLASPPAWCSSRFRRGRRGPLGTPRLIPVRHADSRGDDRSLRAALAAAFAAFGWWAIVSALLGLGFTFFSGATEAWLVDALTATRFEGQLEGVFARGQVIVGAMHARRLGGRRLSRPAHQSRRAVRGSGRDPGRDVLSSRCVMMRDLGFTPDAWRSAQLAEMKKILSSSIEHGLKVPAVRAIMLAGMFSGGVGIYVFYALQPHLLNLWGNQQAYGIAGLVAALVAGAQIIGGLLTPWIRRAVKRRTSALLILEALGVAILALIGLDGELLGGRRA